MTNTDAGYHPLDGRRILVTRAPHQASELVDRLSALGATPVLIPTIEIGPPESFDGLDSAIQRLADFKIVVFTSANAVRSFQGRYARLQISAKPARIAAVGPATAKALEALGWHADVMPEIFTAEALARALRPESQGNSILLVLAMDTPGLLHQLLVDAGAHVYIAHAYRNQIPEGSTVAIARLFAIPQLAPDAVTFTSASTAYNLNALLSRCDLNLPASVARVSIGPITSRAMAELGFPTHIEASTATISALVDATVQVLTMRTF